MATHVELFEEGLRTGVQIPPAPPDHPLKAAKDNYLAAFFIGKSTTYATTIFKTRGGQTAPPGETLIHASHQPIVVTLERSESAPDGQQLERSRC